MQLKTKNSKIIVKNVEYCRTIFEQARGLMFRLPIKDKCLIFVFRKESRPHFHMLFVFFHIDMVFLDSNRKIVDLRSRVRPFRLEIKPRKDCRFVIELPAGTIRKSRLKVGDRLSF